MPKHNLYEERKAYLAREIRKLAKEGYIDHKTAEEGVKELDKLNAIEMAQMHKAFSNANEFERSLR